MLILPATDLPRAMQCNDSLTAPRSPVVKAADPIREEGNAAHWLIEQVYKGKFTLDELIDRQAPNGIFITAEMADNVAGYLLAIGKGGDIEVSSEIGDQKTWKVTNRADHVKVTPDTLRIDDFKYGYSLVEPEMNWTLIAYAAGYIQNNRAPYPQRVILTIHQPRAYHPRGKVRNWEISYATLESLYAQIQATLSNPSNILCTGNECRNCPSMEGCIASLKASMNAIDVSDHPYVSDIDDESLAIMLDTMERGAKILAQKHKAYKELAQHRIESGKIVRNYSLEIELTNRQWKNHVTPEFMQAITGQDLTEKTLITPAQAEKKGVQKEIVDTLAHRQSKGKKLVRIDENVKGNKLFNKKGN